MLGTTEYNKINELINNMSKCVNITNKTFYNKELIINNPIKKQICFILSGKASIIKTDINGNTTIMKELKTNDIFSNLFYQGLDDDIYIISNGTTNIAFIDYYNLLKCNLNCPFHNNLNINLFELLIKDNKEQNDKIELLSKRSVREKLIYFLKKRVNKNNIFKVTTSYKAIAEYICVDRSNLMRELKKMENEGLIKKDPTHIEILKALE